MKFKFLTINDKTLEISNPYSVSINKEKDVPADDLTVVFPFYYNIDELKSVEVLSDDIVIFSGIIDEQIVELDSKGCFLKLSSRSYSALLLDNEALPQTYYNPSLQVVFDRHIKKYGFYELRGDKRVFAGKFIVTKGMSEWDVLEEFCKLYLNITPIVISDRIIDATGESCSLPEITLKNFDGGVCYASIKQNIKRYNLVSEVFIRTGKDSTYNVRVCDEKALIKDINRKRYLNATNDRRTPVSLAEEIIDKGKNNSRIITATSICLVPFEIEQRVKLLDEFLGEISNLRICKIKYSLDQIGEKTEITMYREEE